MAFNDCIKAKLDKKLLTKGEIDKILRDFDELFNRYKKTMGDDDAAQAASAKLISVQIEKLKQKKKNAINAVMAQERVVEEIQQKMAKNNSKQDFEIRELYERAYIRGRNITRQVSRDLGDFINKHRARWGGLTQDHDGMVDVTRELLGEPSGNSDAALFGRQIREAFDVLHKRYQNAGGIIGKLDNYFPQVHRMELVKKSNPEDWINYLYERLDLDRMIDNDTGLPFDKDKLISLMREDYNDIVSDGRYSLQKRVDKGLSTHGFGGDVAQRREASRFYHFKSADDYLEYNRKYGYGDTGLFDAVIGHLSVMSRDTGIMEIMGPKPNALSRHLAMRMDADANNFSSIKKDWTNGMYEVLSGKTSGNGEEPWYSIALSNTQNLMRSAYLGSAPVSALSDSTYAVLAARMNGLDGMKALKRYISLLNPANASDRRMLARAGYTIETASNIAYSAARFQDDITGKGSFQWMASFTNKASGLEAMTQAARNAATMELQGTIADFAIQNKSWANLPEEFRTAAEAHGITASDWITIKKAKLFEHSERPGVTFLRSDDVAKIGGEDALRISNLLGDWEHSIRETASNNPTLRTRAISTGAATGKANLGSLNRMMMSSLTMFKGFGITVIFNHLIPAMRNAKKGKIQNLAILALGGTVLGALSLQMRDMLKGRDPRKMDTPGFWAASALQGGGFGLFGDYFFADYSRFGRDPIVDSFGPVVGLASDSLRVTMGNFNRALDEDHRTFESFMRDTFGLAKRHIPAGNLWYSRLVLERALLDGLEEMIDPNYSNNARKFEKSLKRDYGQRFWWAPGELTPDRLPDLETVTGN